MRIVVRIEDDSKKDALHREKCLIAAHLWQHGKICMCSFYLTLFLGFMVITAFSPQSSIILKCNPPRLLAS